MRVRIDGGRMRRWLGIGVALIGASLGSGLLLAQEAEEKEAPREGRPATVEIEDMLPPPIRTFVGKLRGAPDRRTRIGLVTEEREFVAYACSDDDQFNRQYAHWLRGEVDEQGRLQATGGEGMKLTARIADNTLAGTLTGPDGKPLEFEALRVEAYGHAGLYRAEAKVDEVEVVAGWVVDEDELVVGAIRRSTGQVTTPRPADRNANLAADLGDGEQAPARRAVEEQVEAGSKLDEAARRELLAERVARLRAKGGSPLHAVVLNQMRRFNAGQQPQNDIERRNFAILRRAPRREIQEYLTRWDALPAETRNAILGPSANLASVQVVLDNQVLGSLLDRIKRQPLPPSEPQGPPPRQVQIRQLVCVKETPPPAAGSDEIFVVYTMAMGGVIFDPKTTSIYGDLDTGDPPQPFNTPDALVFPPAGQAGLTVTEPLEISAAAFEDDSRGQAVLEFLGALAELAVNIVGQIVGTDTSSVAGSVGDFFDALAAVLPKTNFLGFDTLVVRPDGRIVNIDGQTKNSFVIQKFGSGGNLKARYDLRDIRIVR